MKDQENNETRQKILDSTYEEYRDMHYPAGEDDFTEDEIREVLKGAVLNEEEMEQAKDFFRIMPYLMMKVAAIKEEIDERGITEEQYKAERQARNKAYNEERRKKAKTSRKK